MNGELLNNDCLPILANLHDRSVDATLTDPPFPNGQGLFNDTLVDGYAGLYLACKKTKGTVIFFWTPLYAQPAPPPGWYVNTVHIWHKPDAKSIHAYELIVVWSREYKRKPSRVFSIPLLDYRTLADWKPHPTQKPVKLLRYLLDMYTKEGDLVLDPFAGSGSTAVACEQTRRQYLSIERDPEYVMFAQQRLRPKTEQPEPTKETPPVTKDEEIKGPPQIEESPQTPSTKTKQRR